MSKEPAFEWLVADDEQTWDKWEQCRSSDQGLLGATLIHRSRCYPICAWGLVLLLAAGAGYWQWRSAAEQRQVRTELQAIVNEQIGQARVEQQPPLAALPMQRGPAGAGITVQTVTLRDDTVMAQVTIAVPAAEARRVTWFYKQGAGGWQRTVPNVRFWGTPENLETTYFRFAFHTGDAAVVRAVTDRIDDRYRRLRSSLGLSPFVTGKETITVSVEATLLPDHYQIYQEGPMVISAPALYEAPFSLSETEILAQAVTLLLGAKVLQEWSRTAAVHDGGLRWPPMMTALRLWQLWEGDGPLAIGHYEIVQGLYAVRQDPSGRSMQRELPASYDQICTAFQTWHLSAKLLIPLACSSEDPQFWYAQPAPRHVKELARPLSPEDIWLAKKMDTHGEAVALATLIEYIVAVYGRARLPMLLSAFSHHHTWETLIPAVFDCSATEFETGWHQYMVEHYNVVLP